MALRARPDGQRTATETDRPPPAVRTVPSSGSFDDLYTANFHRLILQLYAYTGDMAQAEDVVQEAFARAVPRWSKLSEYDDPAAWVRRTAWNLATSNWRKMRTFRKYAQGQRERYVSGPGPDRVAIDAALAKLPERQRRAVSMFYLADMTTAEIGNLMGVPDGTVKSWLSRARSVLATELSSGEEGSNG